MNKISKKTLPANFDIEGHRGCRGLLPENSIPAFQKALELGVTTLEMDLVISKDHNVVVSHEPYLNHEIALTLEGKEIRESEERNYNLYKMEYSEIKKYDCGSKVHPRFPTQEKMKVFKPLFKEVIELAENFSLHYKKPVFYNVEIKSTQDGDNLFHPTVDQFSDLVCQLIEDSGIKERTIVQSFDLRTLQYIRNHYKGFTLSLLIENLISPEKNLEELGFVPDIYSPYFHLVNEHLIKFGKSKGMKIIPWTINTAEEIQQLIDLGVDGIITDYPTIFE